MSCISLYITVAGKNEAEVIANNLVNSRLVAGVNIIENVNSIYHWKGKIENSQELILFAQSKESLLEEIIAEVKKLHSYECPCIIASPIDGSKEFLDWINSETK